MEKEVRIANCCEASLSLWPPRSASWKPNSLLPRKHGVIGCDYFSAYHKYRGVSDCAVQFCFAHLIRDIRYSLEILSSQITYQIPKKSSPPPWEKLSRTTGKPAHSPSGYPANTGCSPQPNLRKKRIDLQRAYHRRWAGLIENRRFLVPSGIGFTSIKERVLLPFLAAPNRCRGQKKSAYINCDRSARWRLPSAYAGSRGVRVCGDRHPQEPVGSAAAPVAGRALPRPTCSETQETDLNR